MLARTMPVRVASPGLEDGKTRMEWMCGLLRSAWYSWVSVTYGGRPCTIKLRSVGCSCSDLLAKTGSDSCIRTSSMRPRNLETPAYAGIPAMQRSLRRVAGELRCSIYAIYTSPMPSTLCPIYSIANKGPKLLWDENRTLPQKGVFRNSERAE